MQDLPFLRSARRLMLIDICMKFCEDSFRGFLVIERTQFVTDRQTDRQTDGRTDGRTSGRPGKNNMSPNPSGGDIIKLTRLELFYEEKLWIYTYDLQENNITITQIQLVLVATL